MAIFVVSFDSVLTSVQSRASTTAFFLICALHSTVALVELEGSSDLGLVSGLENKSRAKASRAAAPTSMTFWLTSRGSPPSRRRASNHRAGMVTIGTMHTSATIQRSLAVENVSWAISVPSRKLRGNIKATPRAKLSRFLGLGLCRLFCSLSGRAAGGVTVDECDDRVTAERKWLNRNVDANATSARHKV